MVGYAPPQGPPGGPPPPGMFPRERFSGPNDWRNERDYRKDYDRRPPPPQ